MLVRAIIDHVPPVFGKKNFNEVANQYGGKSFKEMMQHLQLSLRALADECLHAQIRSSESLPTETQILSFDHKLDLI